MENDCILPKIKKGHSRKLIFHVLKMGSRRPFRINTYSIKAEYKDVFGNVISTYAYPIEEHRKPIGVDYNKISLILAPKETMRLGRYDIFICIVLDEHVNIHIKKTVEVTDDEECCCCEDDIHFDVYICEILYEDGRTYVPVINNGYLSFSIEDIPPPEPVQLIPTYEIINGTLWINGVDTGFAITAVPGEKGDKGDDGKCYVWLCSRFPQVGDTIMINHEWHVLTADDLPPAVGTILSISL